MELLEGIIADDLFIYLPLYKTFILSDVHIGFEESLNNRGVLIPRNNFDDIILRLEKSINRILKSGKIDSIIINGDLIHEFSKVPSKVKSDVRQFIKSLEIYAPVKIISGNHDKALKFIVDGSHIVDKIILGDILIVHGDRLPDPKSLKDIKTIIVGHEHPAVNITHGARAEKFKCFLVGRYLRKNLVVMPSCNVLVEGTDVLVENLLSPILRETDVLSFNVFVVEDKIYDFGKARRLARD